MSSTKQHVIIRGISLHPPPVSVRCNIKRVRGCEKCVYVCVLRPTMGPTLLALLLPFLGDRLAAARRTAPVCVLRASASNVVVRLSLLPCPQARVHAPFATAYLPPPPLSSSLSPPLPLCPPARSPALTFRLACLDRLSFSNSKTHSSCPLLLKVNPPARNLKAASCSHRGALALSPALQIPPPLTHGLCVACEARAISVGLACEGLTASAAQPNPCVGSKQGRTLTSRLDCSTRRRSARHG